jgi:hypothetical protein
MMGLTLRVVAKTLFDTDLSHDSETVHEAMEDIIDALIDFAPAMAHEGNGSRALTRPERPRRSVRSCAAW